MKKKVIIVFILIALVIVLLMIPKDVYLKIFNKSSGDDVPVVESKQYFRVYAIDQYNYLTGVNVPLDEIEEDQIVQKWDLLTKDCNLLPSGYSSPINADTTLLNYEINDEVLVLNVSQEFVSSNGRKAVECLAWNYCDDLISDVHVMVDGKIVNELNGYYFTSINKDLGVNLTFDSSYLFETSYSTIVFYEGDLIIPVTYFFDDTLDVVTYTLNKVFKNDEVLSEMVMSEGYTYVMEEDVLVINIDVEVSFDTDLVNTLTDTIERNFNVSGFRIATVDSVLLEQTFIEVDNTDINS